MSKEKPPADRLGDFAEEREKIIKEYSCGNYLKTSADLAMEEEGRKKDNKDIDSK